MAVVESSDHHARVLAFRAKREARYRSAEGWLSLVDRIELAEGDNQTPFGSVALAADGSCEVRVEQDVRVDGAPLAPGARVRVAPGSTTAFEHGGLRYEIAGAKGRMSVRVRDPNAPALRSFGGIPVYPIDEHYLIVARYAPVDPPVIEKMTRTDQAEVPTPKVGHAHFTLDGSEHALAVYLEESTGRHFIPFADATSGEETYGAGRLLYVEPPGHGGTVVLDFNLAHNLPCAFNWRVACPVFPAHNRLKVAIRAGERTPEGAE